MGEEKKRAKLQPRTTTLKLTHCLESLCSQKIGVVKKPKHLLAFRSVARLPVFFFASHYGKDKMDYRPVIMGKEFGI
jgi:hypothetical protein